MRLVVTKCQQCNKITDAKHADTIEDLTNISEFIREKNNLNQKPEQLYYGPSASPLAWCNCQNEIDRSEATTVDQAG